MYFGCRDWHSGIGLDKLGVGVWDPDKIVLVADHYVPAADVQAATILKTTREFATAFSASRRNY